MQLNYSQYTDLSDAKERITEDIDLYANLAIEANRNFPNISLTGQMERYRQAVEYIELMPVSNEKYRLVESYSEARGIGMLAAALEIVSDDSEFFDVKWPAIEEIRTRQKDSLEALSSPATVSDAVAIRFDAYSELISLY